MSFLRQAVFSFGDDFFYNEHVSGLGKVALFISFLLHLFRCFHFLCLYRRRFLSFVQSISIDAGLLSSVNSIDSETFLYQISPFFYSCFFSHVRIHFYLS